MEGQIMGYVLVTLGLVILFGIIWKIREAFLTITAPPKTSPMISAGSLTHLLGKVVNYGGASYHITGFYTDDHYDDVWWVQLQSNEGSYYHAPLDMLRLDLDRGVYVSLIPPSA